MAEEHEDHAELAALADGTLRGRRRAELEQEVARSPELRALLAEQEWAVALLSGLDLEAPANLRERVAPRAKPRRFQPRPLHLGAAVGATAALAVVAIAVILALGGASSPSLAKAAALGQRPAAGAAPAARTGQPKLLAVDVEGVPFPNWAAKFGWEPVGTRTDTIRGRRATTVFYSKAGKRLAYTIVAGDPLKVPSGGAPAVREGTRLLAFADLAGRPAVTWLREGHTCLLTADGVPRATMLKLAGWKGQGAVPF
jgi:hypothetical protein